MSMQCQWTAITEQHDQGWVAYFMELPQTVTSGKTQAEACETLDWAVGMILEAGRGGADSPDADADFDAVLDKAVA